MKDCKALEKLVTFLQGEIQKEYEDGRKYLVGAIALDDRGNIISMRTNIPKTHPRMRELSRSAHWGSQKIFLHAEVATLVSSYTHVHTLIIARIKKDGTLAIAKPCPICRLAIKEAKVKKAYYTDEAGELTLLEENNA